MSAITLPLPAIGDGLSRRERSVEIGFREDVEAERLSPRELEALGPVLPELVAELLAIMAVDQDPER